MKDSVVAGLVACACVVGIIAGVMYINAHVDCFNFFGLAKGCVVSK
jgi:hypothetical protein